MMWRHKTSKPPKAPTNASVRHSGHSHGFCINAKANVSGIKSQRIHLITRDNWMNTVADNMAAARCR